MLYSYIHCVTLPWLVFQDQEQADASNDYELDDSNSWCLQTGNCIHLQLLKMQITCQVINHAWTTAWIYYLASSAILPIVTQWISKRCLYTIQYQCETNLSRLWKQQMLTSPNPGHNIKIQSTQFLNNLASTYTNSQQELLSPGMSSWPASDHCANDWDCRVWHAL